MRKFSSQANAHSNGRLLGCQAQERSFSALTSLRYCVKPPRVLPKTRLDVFLRPQLPGKHGYLLFAAFICSGGVTRITPCSSRYKLKVISLTLLESSLIRTVKALFAPFPSTLSGK